MRRNEHIYATAPQEAYISRLRAEVDQYRTAKWPKVVRRLLRSEASVEIKMLLAAVAEGKARRAEAVQ
jgi:hypothetical protein